MNEVQEIYLYGFDWLRIEINYWGDIVSIENITKIPDRPIYFNCRCEMPNKFKDKNDE